MVFGVVCGVGRGSLGGSLGVRCLGMDGWMGGGGLSLTYFSMRPIISCLYLTFIAFILHCLLVSSIVPLDPVH